MTYLSELFKLVYIGFTILIDAFEINDKYEICYVNQKFQNAGPNRGE